MLNKVLIIAEAGVNHNGDLAIAKELISQASLAGADYVKFQTFKADKLVSRSAVKASYQLKNINDGDDSQYTMLKKLEMPEQWHYELIAFAKEKNIKFLSTGFDEDSVDFLEMLGIDLYKIPSGEITNRPYLTHIAKKNKPVVLSTGMADLEEIKEAMEVIMSYGLPKDLITVLHCNTEYPTPMDDVNLLAMNTIHRELGVKVGYSDHTEGIEVSIAAVALGAMVIEKHFTLDKTMSGPDHLASIEPAELTRMIKSIRNIEKAISGNGNKYPSPSEQKNKVVARKSIHLKKALQAGHIITAGDLDSKRPGDGISPMLLEKLIGKKIKRNLPEEYKLTLNDID